MHQCPQCEFNGLEEGCTHARVDHIPNVLDSVKNYKVDHSSDVEKKVSDSWLMDSRGIMCELKK